MTVKKGQRIQLQNFEFGVENNDQQESSNVQIKFRWKDWKSNAHAVKKDSRFTQKSSQTTKSFTAQFAD